MLVIEHRGNHHLELDFNNYSSGIRYGEIDVQINHKGRPIVRHNPYGDYTRLDMFIKLMKYDKVFVDIKQNLDVRDLKKILNECDNRLIGLFDVPYPSLYYANKAGLLIYHRLSEFEPAHRYGMDFWPKKYWLDLLTRWDAYTYDRLLTTTPNDSKVIVACPSLHQQELFTCEQVWKWIKLEKTFGDKIQGIVTKHVDKFREVMNEAS